MIGCRSVRRGATRRRLSWYDFRSRACIVSVDIVKLVWAGHLSLVNNCGGSLIIRFTSVVFIMLFLITVLIWCVSSLLLGHVLVWILKDRSALALVQFTRLLANLCVKSLFRRHVLYLRWWILHPSSRGTKVNGWCRLSSLFRLINLAWVYHKIPVLIDSVPLCWQICLLVFLSDESWSAWIFNITLDDRLAIALCLRIAIDVALIICRIL